MLKDRTNRLAIWALNAYVHLLMRRHFNSVQVDGFGGFDLALRNPASYPLVLYGHHRSWWDGFFAFALGRHYGMQQRVMMEEKNLQKYRFFRRVGAFGVNLESVRSRSQSFRHALHFLRGEDQRRCFLIYPQGRLVSPLEKHWPSFQPGLESLLRLCPAVTAIPLIHEIVPVKHPLPDVWIELGKPLLGRHRPSLGDLEAALQGTYESFQEKALALSPSHSSFFLRQPKAARS